ncbi:MAG TPA: SLC13 family permease [Candidatus Limnocylindrales bacterium]|nr:SLC13 family permease [Candidatus Limnocylindrales bacterium]
MQILIVLAILLASVVLFVTELVPADLVALGIMIGLILTGILTPEEAIAGFSNPALITVAAMFVLSAGLLRTGAVGFIGKKIIQISGKDEKKLLLSILLVVTFISAFINNTPVMMVFLPIILGISYQTEISPSKLLIPTSYATIIGGTCTLIGTSTNVLVSFLIKKYGFPELKMFEFTQLGIIFAVAGILYIFFIGYHLLPRRASVTGYISGNYIKEYLTEMEIIKGSSLAGKTLSEAILKKYPDIKILQLIRGEEILWTPLPSLVLKEGDVLLVRGSVTDIVSLYNKDDVELLPDLSPGEIKFKEQNSTLAELVITPNSSLIGRTTRGVGFRNRYGVTVVAIQRHGIHIREKISQIRLRLGDTLLVLGDVDSIVKLRDCEDFLLLEGIEETVIYKDKAPIAIGIMLMVIVLAALDFMSILVLSLLGVMLMILTRCIPLKAAYRSVDMSVMILIAGTIALGTAMEKTHAAELIAHHLISMVGFLGPTAVLSAFYLLTSFLTAVMSNNATAVLLIPIAISTATSLGVNPKPFILAVMFGASADFSTPIGYQTNTMVYGPGGYKFIDYVKVGTPLNVLFWILATLFLPYFWPLK